MSALEAYLDSTRQLILDQIEQTLPRSRYDGGLYDLLCDYPRRGGKMLRPALCLAMGRALGAPTEALLPSAVVLEMYHSAFLIHDDVEDGSQLRRGRPTMHRAHGVPIAVHVGDAMLATALAPLLDNTEVIGLGPALAVLQEIATMARETAEGQMMELAWIRQGRWDLRDSAYLRLIYKKTSWYSFITPLRVAAWVARCESVVHRMLHRLGTLLGAAFQIRDDVLSLAGQDTATGKDELGDLWEGKHTLILAHALRSAPAFEREQALAALRWRQPSALERCIEELRTEGTLSAAEAARLLAVAEPGAERSRSAEDVSRLQQLVLRQRSLEYARSVAARHATGARRVMNRLAAHVLVGPDFRFLEELVDFVQEREL